MSNVTPIRPNLDEPWEASDDDLEPLVLLPEGDYAVAYVSHAYRHMFGDVKLTVIFQVSSGPYQGLTLERFYNMRKLRKRYAPPPNRRSLYRREMLALTGSQTSTPIRLKGVSCIATVATVVVDRNGNDLVVGNQYSRISGLRKS